MMATTKVEWAESYVEVFKSMDVLRVARMAFRGQEMEEPKGFPRGGPLETFGARAVRVHAWKRPNTKFVVVISTTAKYPIEYDFAARIAFQFRQSLPEVHDWEVAVTEKMITFTGDIR